MRSFVAFEIAPAVSAALDAFVAGLPASSEVRWIAPAEHHVTIKFLGDVDPERLPELGAALAAAGALMSSFPLALAGLGAFPAADNPRVLIVHLDDPTHGCETWLARAEPLLADLGFAAEERAFVAHVTLGRSRSREGGRVLSEVLARRLAPPVATFEVARAILFESKSGERGRGPAYVPRVIVPFGAPAPL